MKNKLYVPVVEKVLLEFVLYQPQRATYIYQASHFELNSNHIIFSPPRMKVFQKIPVGKKMSKLIIP